MSALQTCVLLVHLKFKSDEDVSRFADIFKPMTDYVKEKEPGHTYAYKLLKSESDPLHLTIYERYLPYTPCHIESSSLVANFALPVSHILPY